MNYRQQYADLLKALQNAYNHLHYGDPLDAEMIERVLRAAAVPSE